MRQLIYSFIFLFVGFGFISQVAAETWYVKKSKTKLQAESKARYKVLGKLNKGTPINVLGKSGNFIRSLLAAKQNGSLDSN